MCELTVYRDSKKGPMYREFYEKTEVDKILAEKDAKIASLVNTLHLDNGESLNIAVEQTKRLEAELNKAHEEIQSLKVKLNKKGASNVRLECEKRDLWLRFVQLRRALCRLRIGFALHFGGANSGKRIVAYWKHRCKTAPYWDSKTYKDIPQTPTKTTCLPSRGI